MSLDLLVGKLLTKKELFVGFFLALLVEEPTHKTTTTMVLL